MAQVKLLKIGLDGIPSEFDSGADEITLASGTFGNVLVSGNDIVSSDTNGNLALTPDGTGNLVLDGLNWPQADGLAGELLVTDGAGQLSFTSEVQAARVVNGYTAEVAVADRDAVYISSADNVSPAQANAAATSYSVGFAKAAAALGSPVPVVSEGLLDGFAGLTAGARYYLDPAVAGAVSATLPNGSGNIIVLMGMAKSATELQIQIQNLGRRA